MSDKQSKRRVWASVVSAERPEQFNDALGQQLAWCRDGGGEPEITYQAVPFPSPSDDIPVLLFTALVVCRGVRERDERDRA